MRDVNRYNNCANRTVLAKNNTSGCTGVSRTRSGKWEAWIGVDGKKIRLGLFTNKLAAIAKRKAAERKHYGEFAPNPVPEHMKFHPPQERALCLPN